MTATMPTTNTWQIDSAHTSAQFAVRHMMISTVKGSFSNITGTVSFDPDTGHADIDVAIPVATIDTRSAQRDDHLRSPDFFDAASYPTISFKGKRVQGDVNKKFKLIGDLTMRGVTREVVLDVVPEGSTLDPYGNERLGFSASARVNRQDFGLKWNMVIEAGGVTVGDEVKISIDAEVMRPAGA